MKKDISDLSERSRRSIDLVKEYLDGFINVMMNLKGSNLINNLKKKNQALVISKNDYELDVDQYRFGEGEASRHQRYLQCSLIIYPALSEYKELSTMWEDPNRNGLKKDESLRVYFEDNPLFTEEHGECLQILIDSKEDSERAYKRMMFRNFPQKLYEIITHEESKLMFREENSQIKILNPYEGFSIEALTKIINKMAKK